MAFELATARRVVFGDGTIGRLPELARALAPGIDRPRALLVVGASGAQRHAVILESLDRAAFELDTIAVAGEPSTEDAREGAARAAGVHLVIAIGGGSALDAGKAIAALAGNGGDPLDYLEVIGRGRPLERRSLPFVAIPTTAGAGSEVTKNAVLAEPGSRVKVSLRSEHMLPDVALVDPELTWSVPPSVTASTGLDAITQVIEPFVSIAANPITDAICRDAIARGARALARAYADGSDREARRDMALVSVCGGIALANAKLGAVHGLAGPIGGSFAAPHGAICARLLPLVIEANVIALRARAPRSPILGRYDELGALLSGDPSARAGDAIAWADRTVRALAIPRLASWGLERAAISEIVEKAARTSSMKGNPIALESRELAEILERAL